MIFRTTYLFFPFHLIMGPKMKASTMMAVTTLMALPWSAENVNTTDSATNSPTKLPAGRRRQSTTSRSVERAATGRILLQEFYNGVQRAENNED